MKRMKKLAVFSFSLLMSLSTVLLPLSIEKKVLADSDNGVIVGEKATDEFSNDDEASLFGTGGKTVDDAINWLWSVQGQQLDNDGVYPGQCVDLIKSYADYLGQPHGTVFGNAKDYAWNNISAWAGWQRIQGAQPQKGDILIYTNGDFGHVAIYESDSYTWHQNFDGKQYVVRVAGSYWHWNRSGYWGVIRPDFVTVEKGAPMKSGYDRVLPDGDYLIVNPGSSDKDTFWYLDIAGSDYPAKNNTNVAIYSMDAQSRANQDIDYEVWTIEYSDGFYTIKQKGTEMYLDVTGNTSNGNYLNRGSNIEVFENYSLTQKWAISRNTNTENGYRIQAQCSGYSLDLSGGILEQGRNIQQWTSNDTNAQSWMFIPYKPAQDVDEGRYILRSKGDSSLGIDTETDNVQLGTCSEYNSKNESFDVIKQDNGYYKLINPVSGKALSVKNGSSSWKANVELADEDQTTAQEWAFWPYLYKQGGVEIYVYKIVSRSNGQVLYTIDNSEGANIVTFTNSYIAEYEDGQQWVFTVAEHSIHYECGYSDPEMVSNMPEDQLTYYKGSARVSSQVPELAGYQFVGWENLQAISDSDRILQPDQTIKNIWQDLTLEAMWKANPTPTPTATPTSAPIEPTVTPIPGEPTVTPIPGEPTVTPVPGEPTVTPVPDQPTPTTTPTVTPKPTKPTPVPTQAPVFSDFVERLYTCALNRASEPGGKKFWTDEVTSGRRTGGDCARYFLLEAPEFMNRNLSVEDFVETLYKTFFDRASDAAGKQGWVDAIKSGAMTRAVVVENFIESTEWCNICAKYSVKSGAKYHKATVASPNAISFATRLYTCCLKRGADVAGVNYWSLALTNLEQTGCSAAREFFTGPEFTSFKTSPEEYVRRLYTTFMNRNADEGEITYWASKIRNNEMSRFAVLQFFGQSQEFTNICAKYGIDRGTI